MSKIYANQTDLTIKLDTKKDLSNTHVAKIAYKNPKGILGEWNATIDSPINGIISYSIVSELKYIGQWVIWAKTIDSQGLISIGESSALYVYEQGN
jgi:hypothetical protein